MIVEDLSNVRNNNFFAIIIGSGPAGICTALELERKRIKSLIIEAGINYLVTRIMSATFWHVAVPGRRSCC